MSFYVYSPLPQRSVRLLHLAPEHGNTTLCFELEVFTLDKRPKYNALSYCWGTTIRTVPIKCNGKEMLITNILNEALHVMLSHHRGGAFEWLWIDQICINQEDVREREVQVDLMRDIYRTSERTIVWLGPDVSSLLKGVELLERLSLRYNQDLKVDGSRKRRRYTKDEYRLMDLPLPEESSWAALRYIFSRAWFTRSWVIQEAALSSISPHVICGSYELSWESIKLSGTWILSMCYRLTPLSLDETTLPALRSLKLFNELANVGLPWDLTTLLNKSIRFKASNPRDRIYSLIGLAADTGGLHGVPLKVHADYQNSVRAVFRNVTRHIITSTGRLSILTLIRYPPNWEEYPSWVVDFTRNVLWERLSYFAWEPDSDSGHKVVEIKNKAAAGLSAAVEAPTSEDSLALKGLRIDTINGFSDVMSSQSIKEYGSQPLTAWGVACHRLRARYPQLDTLARAFMLTLSANWHFDNSETMADHPMDHFWAYMTRLYEVSLKESTSDEARSHIEEHFATILPQSSAVAITADSNLYGLHLDAAYQRRIFFTESSSYLGLGPAILRDGDILCILFGAATPVLLRPAGPAFRFLGECYVHGLMEGEAVEEWRRGNLNLETFQLI